MRRFVVAPMKGLIDTSICFSNLQNKGFPLCVRSIFAGGEQPPARIKHLVESAVCDHIFDLPEQNRRVAVEWVAGGIFLF